MQPLNTTFDEKTEALRQKWVGMSVYFSEEVEPVTLQHSLSNFELLLSKADFHNKKLKIAELGCASGIFCKAVLEKYSELIDEYLLVDISDTMIELAKKRLNNYTADSSIKIELRVLSMDDLQSVDDNHYEIVVSNFCIHLVAYPDKAFTEVHRILKAGGLFGASVLGGYEGSQRFETLISLAKEMHMDNPNPQVYSQFKYGKPDLFAAAGENSGFTAIHTKEFYNQTVFSKDFTDKNINFCKQYLKPEASSEELEVFGKEYQKRMEEQSNDSGVVKTLGIFAAFKK